MSALLGRIRAALSDRYTIEREIGRGGMATVYLADDLRHERKVAVKVLDAEISSAVGTERFLNEIRTTANLAHPQILPLFDSGEVDGLLFYVMPFVAGESLRQRLDREGRLPIEEAVRIAAEIADGLDYAHQKGLIHRDIKPENILFEEGHAVVADFGVARAVGGEIAERVTATGAVVGTPIYMSPEQALGGDLDSRTDLYSLGCVLYEMLTGRPPFHDSSAQAVLAQRLTRAPPSIARERPEAPLSLGTTVSRLLSRRPEDRVPTAGELRDMLLTSIAPSVSARRFRRMAVALVVWLLASMLLFEAANLAVDRYVLSYHLPRFVITAALLLVPTVLLLANAGFGPARRPFSRLEKAGIPLTLVIAATILVVQFRGADLGAATTSIRLTDEEGRTFVRRGLPKPEMQRRLVVYPFTSSVPDTAFDWMQYGIAFAVVVDLRQELFLSAHGMSSQIHSAQRMGYRAVAALPITLQRRLAANSGDDFFVTGTLGPNSDTTRVSAVLFETESGKEVSRAEFRARNLFELADSVSAWIKSQLDIPKAQLERSPDLPVRELLTRSDEAFRALVMSAYYQVFAADTLDSGVAAWNFRGEQLQRAATLDTTFALAWAYYGMSQFRQPAEAVRALETALRHSYRLTERDLLLVKGRYFRSREEPEKELAILRMHVAVDPGDLETRRWLVNACEDAGRYEEALEHLDQIRRLSGPDSISEAFVVQQIASDLARAGRVKEAKQRLEESIALAPNDIRVLLAAAAIYGQAGSVRMGEPPELRDRLRAAELYDAALLLDPGSYSAIKGAADVAFETYRFGEAASGYRKALSMTRARSDLPWLYQDLYAAFSQGGQIDSAMKYSLLLGREGGWGEPASPMYGALVLTGRRDDAVSAYDSLVQSGVDDSTRIAEAFKLYHALEQPDSTEKYLSLVFQHPRPEQTGAFRSLIEAEIARWHGDCPRALERYAQVEPVSGFDPNRKWLGMAVCLRRTGRLEEARATLREAIEDTSWINFPDPQRFYELALVDLAAGDTAAGRTQLSKVLEIWEDADPGYVPARKARELQARLDSARSGQGAVPEH